MKNLNDVLKYYTPYTISMNEFLFFIEDHLLYSLGMGVDTEGVVSGS